MSTVSMRMRRGWFRDPEDHHGTYRMEGALRILKGYGAEPTFPEHDEACICHPSNRWNRVFGHSYSCSDGCTRGSDPTPTWPEWVTDECFDAAYRAADVLQTERGTWNRNEAYAGREARRAAERAAKI